MSGVATTKIKQDLTYYALLCGFTAIIVALSIASAIMIARNSRKTDFQKMVSDFFEKQIVTAELIEHVNYYREDRDSKIIAATYLLKERGHSLNKLVVCLARRNPNCPVIVLGCDPNFNNREKVNFVIVGAGWKYRPPKELDLTRQVILNSPSYYICKGGEFISKTTVDDYWIADLIKAASDVLSPTYKISNDLKILEPL